MASRRTGAGSVCSAPMPTAVPTSESTQSSPLGISAGGIAGTAASSGTLATHTATLLTIDITL
jgi:hypothetical protein